MNELNEKMRKFAGFKQSGFCPLLWESAWDTPNAGDHPSPSKGTKIEHLPDFPNDLNACFKHLEPELYRRGLRYQLNRVHDGHVAKIFKTSKSWADMVAYAVDEKPATAFCKAVELLMDADKADEVEILNELKRVAAIEKKEKA